MLNQLREQWEKCWTIWWNLGESKIYLKIFSILQSWWNQGESIMIIIQKLQHMLHFGSCTSFFLVVSCVNIVDLHNIWDIVRSFPFQSWYYILGLNHLQCHARLLETNFFSPEFKRQTIRWQTNLWHKSRLCISRMKLNVHFIFDSRYTPT